MSQIQLEQALRNFDRIATRVRDSVGRQVWRFEFGGRGYYVTFYPRRTGIGRLAKEGSAMLDFVNLQALQRLAIPSPRAVAQLAGFHIEGIVGDALLVEGISDATRLDLYLQDHYLRGEPVPRRRELAAQLVSIVSQIAKANFGYRQLSLDRFLISDGKLYLQDIRGLRRGGMKLNDSLHLAHSASRFATRSELLRGWDALMPDSMPPKQNPIGVRIARELASESRSDSARFGRIRAGAWTGHYSRVTDHAEPYSAASRTPISLRDWEQAWPELLKQIEADALLPLKRDKSGDVLAADVVLGGRPISIVIKRPRRKEWGQYVGDVVRPSRALRTWLKAWMLIGLHLPCEWPLLVMERKVLGYTIDAVAIFERVPGPTLDQVDLATLPPPRRDMLFRRAGRYLNRIERNGFVHYDSKSTNWIVYQDPAHGAIPVMLDTDGIRKLTFWLQTWSIQRLLRAMKQHVQYTPDDSLALCQGFSPFGGAFVQEPAEGTAS